MWWVLSSLGIALGGWGIASAHRILYPERRTLNIPRPLPAYTIHPLVTRAGVPFDVWRLAPASPKGRLLLCHGYYANRYQVLRLAQGLRERGYEVLLFELRGHGSRPGPCTLGIKETDDALEVLRWARTQDGDRTRPIGVLGLSMGAALACMIAARTTEVQAVVTDSVYSRLFPVLARSLRQRYHLRMWPLARVTWWTVQLFLRCGLSSRDPAVLAPRLRQPLFAIQGGEDRRVVAMLGREFFQRWAGPKERWFEPKVAHVGMFAEHPDEYCDRVARFFDRAFTHRLR